MAVYDPSEWAEAFAENVPERSAKAQVAVHMPALYGAPRPSLVVCKGK